MVGGMAMAVHPPQMMTRAAITVILLVLELSGVMMALLLSRVMASIVNTLAGTLQQINIERLFALLAQNLFLFIFIYCLL